MTQDIQTFIPASLWNNGTNKAKSETLGITLFGARKFSEWTVKGNIFMGGRRLYDFHGWASWHTRWEDSGDDWGTQTAASIELSRNFSLQSDFSVTPYIGLDFSHAPSISMEILELKSYNYTEIPLGIRAAKTFTCGDWSLTPSADATFISSIGHIRDTAYNQHYGYTARTGSEWKVYGVAADHWGGRIKAGMDAKFRDRFNAGVHYTFEGRSHYKDHRIEASFGLAF